jgi:hypothetical protein
VGSTGGQQEGVLLGLGGAEAAAAAGGEKEGGVRMARA